MNALLPTYFLSHGGGPWPWMKEGMPGVFDQLERSLVASFGVAAAKPSQAFDHWFQETMAAPSSERSQRLRDLTSAPSARQAHPREDHLIPLMVAVGAAEDEGANVIYHQDDLMGSWCVSSFQLGARDS